MQPHNVLSFSLSFFWHDVRTLSKLSIMCVYVCKLANEYQIHLTNCGKLTTNFRFSPCVCVSVIHSLQRLKRWQNAHVAYFHCVAFSFSICSLNCASVCVILGVLLISSVCVCAAMPGLLSIVFVWVSTELSVLTYRLAMFNQFSIDINSNANKW